MQNVKNNHKTTGFTFCLFKPRKMNKQNVVKISLSLLFTCLEMKSCQFHAAYAIFILTMLFLAL